MRIKELNTGKSYDLTPGTMVEVERTNPFLNEYGELSIPINLPGTKNNRQLSGYPHELANNNKPGADIACEISDGAYVMPCRQAILGATRDKGITTSFYMNEGSFYSRLNRTSLKEVFGQETVPGVTTPEEALDWCRSILDGTDDNYAIFPVMVRYGEWEGSGWARYKILNRLFQENDTVDFWNSQPRKEYSEQYSRGDVYNLPMGCDMTPFMRVGYLLKRILAHFGYTLSPCWFTTMEPFRSMVFLNNTADAIVTGAIRLTQLLPDCTCNDILDVIRKRFNCEFIPNEKDMSVDIVRMDAALASVAQCDLTDIVDGGLEISYPERYRQIRLVNASPLSDDGIPDNPDTLADLFASYPSATYDANTGRMRQDGYRFWLTNLYPGSPSSPYAESLDVSAGSLPYQDDGSLDIETVELKDRVAEMREPAYFWNDTEEYHNNYCPRYIPFLGGYRYLNTIFNITSEENGAGGSETELLPMLCFVYAGSEVAAGTVTNRVSWSGTKLWDYTLLLHGEDGIFERFYRNYDNLLRNSLHTVSVRLMLSQYQKMSLRPHLPVLIGGQLLWPSILKYVLGVDREPVESELLTLRQYTPVTSGKSIIQYVAEGRFSYEPRWETTEVTELEYESGLQMESDFLFPVRLPTEPGQVLAERTAYFALPISGTPTSWYRIHYWLESVES